MGVATVRVVIGVIGGLMLIGGVLLTAVAGPTAFAGTAWLIIGGVVLLIASLIEVTRYRSEHAERNRLDPGPGGGETTGLEPRFRRTDEVFVDPTSHLRMRVFQDPATGERRYVAENNS